MGIFKKNIFDTDNTLESSKRSDSSEQVSIKTALNYLLSTQKDDGGWGQSELEESSVYMTTVVSMILKQFPRNLEIGGSLDKAANYLMARQNVDGGFGIGPATAYETALAYIALIDNTKDIAVLDRARNYLISMQFADGPYDDSLNSTVSALRALCFENSQRTDTPKPDRYWRDCGMDRYLNKESSGSDNGSVTGKVIDGLTGVPLQDVSIRLESDPELKVMTDISGNFDLFDVPTGSQKILFNVAEYEPDHVLTNVEGGSGVNLGTITLLLNRKAENIEEPLTDVAEEDAETIVAAEVKENKTVDKRETPEKDSKRKVSIVKRRRAGYDLAEPEVVSANEIPLLGLQFNKRDFAAPTGSITGNVFDSVSKQPLENAIIFLAESLSANTDKKGMFIIDDIVPDAYQITISKEEYSDQFYQGVIAAGETMDMLVYLTPACLNADETGEAETDANVRTTNTTPVPQATTVSSSIDRGQLDSSHVERADTVRIGPEILIEIDETLTPSAIVPDGNKQIKIDIRLEGVQVVTNPVVSFAATNSAGNKIAVAFDKVMMDPSGKHTQFGITIDGVSVHVVEAFLNASDNTKIELVPELPVHEGQVILLNYTAGDVASSDGKKLLSFYDQMVGNKALPPIYSQDGFGYSGLVTQNSLQDAIFMAGFNHWPQGFYKNVLAFMSGVFDGQHIWMIPANADSVVKIDKDTGAMTGYNKWPAGFRKGNLAFEGGVFDGQHIWMIPANADSVVKIDKDTGAMTGYNTWPPGFKKGGHAFAGGVFDGQNIWLVPSYAENIVKIDKDTGAMTEYNAWPSGFKKGGYAFEGGVFDGQHIWMIPANADSVVKIDKDTGAMTEYNAWPSEFKKVGLAFAGGVFDGENIWLVPYYADRVITINKNTGVMRWCHQRPSEFNKVEYAFTGGAFDGENIWLVPLNADSIQKINIKTGVESKYNEWPSGFQKGVNAFAGGVFDGQNIWLVPSSADRVVKLSPFSIRSVSANVTANDTFYFYISQDESVEGALVGQGSSWSSVYSLNAALAPGVTNYLHVKSTDASGPIAAFIGDFSLNDENFHFNNGTRHLLTGDDCWTVYTDAFGKTQGTITTICKNGMGKWATRFGIDLNAQWIWTNGGKDYTSRYFSTPIYYSTASIDPVTNVRVINTLSDSNVAINKNSFTKKPHRLSVEGEKTSIEWRFEKMSMGQLENISFDVNLEDPIPGEDRPVSDKLELFYEDVGKRPVRTELGPCRVHIFNTELISGIMTDKKTYTSCENVLINGTIKNLSEFDRSIDTKIIIEDSRGVSVDEILALQGVIFKQGEEKNLGDSVFKTNADYSGDYRAHLIIYEYLKQIGEEWTNFTIEATLPEKSAIIADAVDEDVPNESESLNKETVAEDLIKEVVAPETVNRIEAKSKTKKAVEASENVEESKSDSIATELATELVGTIAAQPNPVYQGLAITISYSVSNDADKDLKDLTVDILITNPDTGEIKKSFEAPAKARKGASIAGSFILSTAAFEPHTYRAILQVAQTKKEEPKIIAETRFEVRLINVIVT